jgi:hypothetical protein
VCVCVNSEVTVNTHKKLISHKCVHKLVYIPVSDNFSFAKLIHPSDRCGISRSPIKQHGHYTGAPCAGGNKRPF